MRRRLGKVQRDLLVAMSTHERTEAAFEAANVVDGKRFTTRALAGASARGGVPAHSQVVAATRALRGLHGLGLVRCWCTRRADDVAWEVVGASPPPGHWIYAWALTPAGYAESERIRSEVEKG
jgi:hypothetical protein